MLLDQAFAAHPWKYGCMQHIQKLVSTRLWVSHLSTLKTESSLPLTSWDCDFAGKQLWTAFLPRTCVAALRRTTLIAPFQ